MSHPMSKLKEEKHVIGNIGRRNWKDFHEKNIRMKK